MWKARLALNYKRIPYRTEWISYPDVKPTLSVRGFTPAGKEYDGSPLYTCPSILDPTVPAPTPVTDSLEIAFYLEKAYPSTPSLFPEGTKDAQLKFMQAVTELVIKPVRPLVMSGVPSSLEDPRGSEYFIRTRHLRWGRPLESLCPAGSEERKETWEKLKRGLDEIAEAYDKNIEGNGEYFTGRSITYADIFLVATFLWTKFIPCDRDEGVKSVWEIIQGLNGGRWAKLVAKFDDYTQVY